MDVYEGVTLSLKAGAVALTVAVLALAGQALAISPHNEIPPRLITNPNWENSPTVSLVPCPTEDSVNCYWDASMRGNSQGRSFINVNGNMYYKP